MDNKLKYIILLTYEHGDFDNSKELTYPLASFDKLEEAEEFVNNYIMGSSDKRLMIVRGKEKINW